MACEQVTQLRLKGQETTFSITADAWRELVEIAGKTGWQSEHAPVCYWSDIGLEVSAADARRLSGALEGLCDLLTDNKTRYPDELAVSQLIDSVGLLVVFCARGAFRVC